jgi:predicted anti-sigma-YlaC factor YlaD
MPCAGFEDLLLDYTELTPEVRETVDAHLLNCEDCREYLEAAVQLDADLADLYSSAQPAPAFVGAVLSRVGEEARLAKPSWLPEALDFVGWTAIIAALACLSPLLPQFRPEFEVVAGLSAAVAMVAAIWAGIRSYADLK